MIERQSKSPLIAYSKIERMNCALGIGEESGEGENGDFWGAGRSGSVEEDRGGGSGDDGLCLRQAGIDGKEAALTPPSSKKEGD